MNKMDVLWEFRSASVSIHPPFFSSSSATPGPCIARLITWPTFASHQLTNSSFYSQGIWPKVNYSRLYEFGNFGKANIANLVWMCSANNLNRNRGHTLNFNAWSFFKCVWRGGKCERGEFKRGALTWGEKKREQKWKMTKMWQRMKIFD